jgi:hypothetical protein
MKRFRLNKKDGKQRLWKKVSNNAKLSWDHHDLTSLQIEHSMMRNCKVNDHYLRYLESFCFFSLILIPTSVKHMENDNRICLNWGQAINASVSYDKNRGVPQTHIILSIPQSPLICRARYMYAFSYERCGTSLIPNLEIISSLSKVWQVLCRAMHRRHSLPKFNPPHAAFNCRT